MKNLLSCLLFLIPLWISAQSIKPGDNIKAEFKKLQTPHYLPASGFTAWAEGSKLWLIGEKPDPNDCEFVFMALRDTTLIGTFKSTKPVTFMFDTAGSAVLSRPTKFFLLPLWIVKRKTKIISSDRKVLMLLDKMYQKTLQANELELDKETSDEYVRYQADTTLANRHIILLFDNYQRVITEAVSKGEDAPADVCLSLMKTLSGECLSLYKTIPVIVQVYLGEALQSAGLIEAARQHFKKALRSYPGSIPLLVYSYQLEKDPKKKKDQLALLKKKYPAHWMVKDLK